MRSLVVLGAFERGAHEQEKQTSKGGIGTKYTSIEHDVKISGEQRVVYSNRNKELRHNFVATNFTDVREVYCSLAAALRFEAVVSPTQRRCGAFSTRHGPRHAHGLVSFLLFSQTSPLLQHHQHHHFVLVRSLDGCRVA
jgi:hypothetical protein